MAKEFLGRGLRLQVAIVVTCAFSFILFGYDQGVFSGILVSPDFLDTFNDPNDSTTGIMVSIYNIGCFVGCVLNFFIADKLGRRRAIWLAMVVVIVGAILQTTAYSLAHLIVARVITGMGTGIETSTVPMYQSEMCDAKYRGRLVSSEVLFVGIGIVIAYFFDYGISYASGPITWRFPIAFQIFFCVVVIIIVFGLPETPRWLFKRGCNNEAVSILARLKDIPEDHSVVVKERDAILEALDIEGDHAFEWFKLLRRDTVQTGKRVLLAWGMQAMNQLGGINLVVYYATVILQNNVGLDRNLSLILGGCIQICFMLGSIVPTFYLDRMGRRATMMWGSFGCGLSMMLIAILLSFDTYNTSAAAVAFFFTYNAIFGGTVNCVPWVYVPEILPLRVRAQGTAIGISSNWIWNFFVVMITPVITTRIGWKSYLIFMITNFLFIPLVYFCYPETGNLTLEEIDLLFVKNREGDAVESVNFQNIGKKIRHSENKATAHSEKEESSAIHHSTS